MTTATTFARLHDLRLSGMAQALTQQQEQSSTYEALPFLVSIPVENSPKVPVENSPFVYKYNDSLVALCG